jgi:hypothetical protein
VLLRRRRRRPGADVEAPNPTEDDDSVELTPV